MWVRVGDVRVAGVCVFVASVLAGCAGGDDDPSPSLFSVDEVAGTVGGVGIGASKAAVRQRFGLHESNPQPYPIEPLDGDEEDGAGGPWSVVTGPHEVGPGGQRGEQVTLRYRGASFFVRRGRVFGFMVTDDGANTSRGVGVGDSLAEARRAHPELTCRPESRGETTAPQEAHCEGRVGPGRYMFLGGDPIESVTLMARPFRGYG